jgi:putative ABC transport system permease protein
MRRLLATLRRRPWPLLGTLVAITLGSMVVVIAASFIGTGATAAVPPDRLAGAAVVVTGQQQISVRFGRGDDAEIELLALPGYRRVPVSLARRLAAVLGVSRAVADVSFPLALDLGPGRAVTGSAAAPVTGHGWPSAALTPLRLRAGTAPAAPGQIVLGAGLARSAGLRVGSTVRLAGQSPRAFRVVGIAGDGRRDAASASSVFFSPAQAAALYSHPGQADLIGVIGAPGAAPAALAARIRAALASGSASGGYTVATGFARGSAENLAVAEDKSNLEALGGAAGGDVVLIAMFVLAGTVALSVAQRHRDFALLRAIGATPGQVRRGVLAELAAIGVLGGVLGWLPGLWLASAGMKTLVSNQLMPPSTVAWHAPWLLAVTTGAGVVVAMLAGLLAARRAGRVRPARSVRRPPLAEPGPHPARPGQPGRSRGPGLRRVPRQQQPAGQPGPAVAAGPDDVGRAARPAAGRRGRVRPARAWSRLRRGRPARVRRRQGAAPADGVSGDPGSPGRGVRGHDLLPRRHTRPRGGGAGTAAARGGRRAHRARAWPGARCPPGRGRAAGRDRGGGPDLGPDRRG